MSADAQTVSIKQPFTDTLLCVEGSFTARIVPTSKFREGNIFRIQLSDSSGSFSNPKQIGFQPGDSFTTVTCYIDTNVIPATGYRIRVVADSAYTGPYPYISPDNGIDIRVSKKPDVQLTYNGPLCIGDTLKFAATTNSPQPDFSWTGPNNFSSGVRTPYKYPSTFADTGLFISNTTSYGCTSVDSVYVEIFSEPKITSIAMKPSEVCEEETFGLQVTCNICDILQTSAKARWYTPDSTIASNSPSFTKLNASVNDTGSYYFHIALSGCKLDTVFKVNVKPLPDTPVASSNSPLCAGDTLQLNSTSSTSGSTYRWEGPGGFTANMSNPTIPNIQSSQAGTYYVYAQKAGCDSKPGKAEVVVGIPLTPLPISGDTNLCPGDRMRLSVQTSRTDGITWFHLPDDSTVVSINRSFGLSAVTANDSGRYVVTQEVNGCKSPPSYVNLHIPNIIAPDPTNNGPLCLGEQLILSATPSNGGQYEWTGPGGFMSDTTYVVVDDINYDREGIYNFTTTKLHCSVTDTTEVTIKAMPKITDISSNSPICSYSQLELFATSDIPGAEFSWSGPNGFTSNVSSPSIYFENNMSGVYTVKAIVDGCESPLDSTFVETKEGPGPGKASSNSPLTEGDKLLLFGENDKQGVTFYWTGPDSFTSNEQNPVIDEATYRSAGTYELTFIYNDCSTSVKTYVDVEDILGVTATLYPNPNDGKFTVEGFSQTDDLINIAVVSSVGKLVYTGHTIPDKSKFVKEIELGNVPSGVYYLRLTTGRERKWIHFSVVRQE